MSLSRTETEEVHRNQVENNDPPPYNDPAPSKLSKLGDQTARFTLGVTLANANQHEQSEVIKGAFEELYKELESDLQSKHKGKVETANKICDATSALQKELMRNQEERETDTDFKARRDEYLATYIKNCKETTGWQKFGKAIAAVGLAVAGLIIGVTVGALIGYGVSAWTGPGGFAGAALGAVMGGAVGVMMGVTMALGLAGGVAAGIGFGHQLFKPSPRERKVQYVVDAVRQTILKA
jgi:hypothetical protein